MSIVFDNEAPKSKGKVVFDDEQKPPNYMGVVGKAVNEAFMRPGTVTRKLASDPVAQAKALPTLTGMAGGISPIPGGATLGTVGGRQLSNLALKAYGRPDQIPSVGQQVGEGALAALGDVAAIPYVKNKVFGSQIGNAEKAAGLITKGADKYPTSGNVGEVLNTLESQLDTGAINTPQAAKEAYSVTKFIHENPKLVGKSGEISVQAQRVGQKAQAALNKFTPGRLGPAQAMARANTIPRAMNKAYQAVPGPVKQGLGLAAAGGIGGLGWEVIRKMIGDTGK